MSSIRAACLLFCLTLTLPVSSAEILEAIRAGDVEQVQEMIEADPSLLTADYDGATLLHSAIGKDVPELWPLVTAKEKVDQINSVGVPPSFMAIFNSNPAALDFVLEQGANANFRKRIDKVTPLHWAAEMGNAEHIQVLLRHGADPSAGNTVGSTALLVAAKFGKLDVVAALLEGEAAPDKANMAGLTPLIFAAQRGHVEVVKALLEGGADPKLRDRRGQSAEDYASQRGRQEVVEILRAASEKE